jgi:hypothetical protein
MNSGNFTQAQIQRDKNKNITETLLQNELQQKSILMN